MFRNLSFMVSHGERVGLVGKNGAGKTTVMRLIVGDMIPTGGVVNIPKELKIGYLPQQMDVANLRTVMDETMLAFTEILSLAHDICTLTQELEMRTDYHSDAYAKIINSITEKTDRYNLMDGDNLEAIAEVTLQGLGFKRDEFTRPTKELSGGWRMRIELAKILLSKPDILLLDEPTNHLDIESIQWLEEYLLTFGGSLLLISHDRAFLDNITERTIELSLGKAFDYRVPYSKYVVLRHERHEQQLATYKNQQKMIADTKEFIERFRYKATKANQVQSRVKMLEKLEIVEVDEEDNAAITVRFPTAPRSGEVVVKAEDVEKSFGNHLVFSDANFHIQRGEKVAFVGRNGEGKTTLSRIIVGELEHDGRLTIGHNVNIGYFAQNQDELMDPKLTVLETIERVAVGDIRTKMRDILGAFLFRGDDVDKKVAVLSGGERNRLAMVKLMLQPYNLLVLDEPTNHLDMRSKDILKNALAHYKGTVVLVSHDREFLNGLVSKVYEFRDGRVKEHIGGLYDFLQRRKMENLKELEVRVATTEDDEPVKEESSQKRMWMDRKEHDKAMRRISSRLEKLEEKIDESEKEMAQIVAILANPDEEKVKDADLYHRYQELKDSLAEYMEQWETLSHELEEMEAKRSEYL